MIKIKLSDYDPKKHRFLGTYYSNRGTELGHPTLPEDWRVEGRARFGKDSGIDKLQKALEKNSNEKADFLIFSGRLGGYGSRYYRLKNISVEVEAKEVP